MEAVSCSLKCDSGVTFDKVRLLNGLRNFSSPRVIDVLNAMAEYHQDSSNRQGMSRLTALRDSLGLKEELVIEDH